MWGYVKQKNLHTVSARIKGVVNCPGRAAIAPEVLFELWLYASPEVLSSALATSAR